MSATTTSRSFSSPKLDPVVARAAGTPQEDGTATATQPTPGRVFLSAIDVGANIDDVFVIRNVQLGTTRTGDPFLKMLVSDRSATVPGKWWQMGREVLEKLPDPGIVRVTGKMENFNGGPQFRIDNIWPVDQGRVNFTDLLASTSKDVSAMFEEVASMLRGFKNQALRDLAEAYLADEELMANFRKAPAAMQLHHAYLGGLLEHTHNAMKVADVICAFYPTLNRDLVVFGIFAHDLGKTWELTYANALDYSDGGKLIGHIVKAAIWAEQKAAAAQAATGRPIPQQLIDVVQHIILSHHGETKLDYGSAKSPATPEALAVHMIENMDAKLTAALVACRGEDVAATVGEGAIWTDRLRMFDGPLYRPDVAPGE